MDDEEISSGVWVEETRIVMQVWMKKHMWKLNQ